MKLQLALDTMTLTEAEQMLEQVEPYIDLIEVGTPLLLREGVHAIKRIKERFPYASVLADTKIMDGGRIAARIAFEAGADVVTVLALAYDTTLEAVLREAKDYGKKVMADMIGIADVGRRAEELDRLDMDYICVHTASDMQHREGSFSQFHTVRQTIDSHKLAIAGGIRLESMGDIIRKSPDIIIVGQGITSADSPAETARKFKEKIKGE